MSSIKFIISIVFLIIIAAFTVVNRHSVPVNYYDLQLVKQSMEVPMILVALAPFVLGFVLAWSFTVLNRVKSKTMINKRNRTISSLNEELDKLKSHSKISEPVGSSSGD
jgi:uncharacterized integral membrane protein